MSILDRLLEGVDVEWIELRKLLVRTTGTKITAEQMKVLHKDDAPVKIFAGGRTFALFNYEDLPSKDINYNPSIIVKSRGLIGFEYYDKPFSHKNEMWSYFSDNQFISIKFIYHFLKVNEPYFQNIGGLMQMPQISTPITDKFKIPIPCPENPEKSLEIQREIVRILDDLTEKNTALISELTKEIELRKKQYEHYRDKLLNFNEIGGGNLKELASIGILFGGLKGKNKSDFINGNAKFISYKNIFFNDSVDFDKLEVVNVSLNENQFEVKFGDVLFTGSSESLEEVGMSSVITKVPSEKIYLNSFCFGLRLNENIELKPDFSKYLFRSKMFRNDVVKTASGVTRYNVSKKNFIKIKIPVPTMEVQERIVKLLDEYVLANKTIIEELTKEIRLRQKEYEYYRNLLLDFPIAV